MRLTGLVKRILFVCSANVDRSPTAERLLKGIPGHEAKSAGTLESAKNHVSRELLDWADVVFAMEERHKRVLVDIHPTVVEKIVVLGIQDVYLRDDPELKEALKRGILEHLPELCEFLS